MKKMISIVATCAALTLTACSSIPTDWSSMSETEISGWMQQDFQAEEAQRWKSLGYAVNEAQAWRDGGFTADEAKEWDSEAFNPDQAKTWRKAGFDLKDAIKSRDKGLTPVAPSAQ
ncbi:MAG: hypothetical protein CL693_15595 [Cellvibrionaceae bacterium]|nr:hypothetical protein [Cellvibrionaceae bacterium]|tara:strand:- start:23814 stop:24161 length:348 start_codon:yes stop_codon:yes gene_type:complete